MVHSDVIKRMRSDALHYIVDGHQESALRITSQLLGMPSVHWSDYYRHALLLKQAISIEACTRFIYHALEQPVCKDQDIQLLLKSILSSKSVHISQQTDKHCPPHWIPSTSNFPLLATADPLAKIESELHEMLLRAEFRKVELQIDSMASQFIESVQLVTLLICTLFHQGNHSRLFQLTHRLFKERPSTCYTPHLSSGLYYQLISKSDDARRSLLRATRINPTITVLWQALGNCYSLSGDHDQAISAFCQAVQVAAAAANNNTTNSSECPISLLNIASEYLSVRRPLLAHPYLSSIQTHPQFKYQHCPFALNEMGALQFSIQKYALAIPLFERALKLTGSTPSHPLGSILRCNLLLSQLLQAFEERSSNLLLLIKSWTINFPLWPSDNFSNIRALIFELAALSSTEPSIRSQYITKAFTSLTASNPRRSQRQIHRLTSYSKLFD